VSDISEHHAEEEGEDGDSEEAGVDLLVAGYAICIDDGLEGGGEFVDLEVGWRLLLGYWLADGYD
jgi:hypothetical protein